MNTKKRKAALITTDSARTLSVNRLACLVADAWVEYNLANKRTRERFSGRLLVLALTRLEYATRPQVGLRTALVEDRDQRDNLRAIVNSFEAMIATPKPKTARKRA